MLRFNSQKIAASQRSDRRLLPRYILGRFVGLERRQSWNRAPPLGDPESSSSEGLRSEDLRSEKLKIDQKNEAFLNQSQKRFLKRELLVALSYKPGSGFGTG